MRTLLLVSIGLYERFEPGFLALDVTSLSIVPWLLWPQKRVAGHLRLLEMNLAHITDRPSCTVLET